MDQRFTRDQVAEALREHGHSAVSTREGIELQLRPDTIMLFVDGDYSESVVRVRKSDRGTYLPLEADDRRLRVSRTGVEHNSGFGETIEALGAYLDTWILATTPDTRPLPEGRSYFEGDSHWANESLDVYVSQVVEGEHAQPFGADTHVIIDEIRSKDIDDPSVVGYACGYELASEFQDLYWRTQAGWENPRKLRMMDEAIRDEGWRIEKLRAGAAAGR